MTVHTTSWPELVEVTPGESGSVSISITNTSEVINAYHVDVFGLDPSWVEASPSTVSLFPGDTQNIDITLRLPDDYPASDRTVSMNVVAADNTTFAMNQVGLSVRPRAETRIALDPMMVTGGRTATFGIVVSNSGNTPVTATGFAIDPEDLAEFEFDPPQVIVEAGREQVIQATASGGRSWFGQIRPRTFTFGVEAEDRIETLGTFLQRPRISRWLITLLALLMAAAVFAVVLSQTFGTVVEQARVQDGLLDAALEPDEAGGARIPANPGTVSGAVTSAGVGLSGVQAVLVDADDPAVLLSSASTDTAGEFTFSNLGRGDYRLQLSGAGIDPVWYLRGDDGTVTVTAAAADASVVPVDEAATVAVGTIDVRGKPVVVSGTLDVDDPAGVTLRLIVPGQIEPGVDAVVAETELSPDGSFVLPDVPSPGAYILVVEKPGLGAQSQDVVIEPGQPVSDLDISFNTGAGLVSGTVSARGRPLDGAVISAVAGTVTYETVSLSGPGDDAGKYLLRNLPVPGRYTVTISRTGYASQTSQVILGPVDDSPEATVNPPTAVLDVVLTEASGSISGDVRFAGGAPVREVAVAITGGDIKRSTNVVSQAPAVGAYAFFDLPAPATYTMTFSSPNMGTQVRIVSLDPRVGQESVVADPVVLSPTTRTIQGNVTQDGVPIGQATVVLSNGASSRTVQTSDDAIDPVGAFEFSGVLPGVYTLSASLPGAATQVRLIDINSSTAPTLTLGNITLGQQASVEGQVYVFEERPDRTQPVRVQRSVLVRLFTPEQFPGGQELAAVTTDAATGAFRFPALEADTYVVAVYESALTTSPLLSQTVSTKPGEKTTVSRCPAQDGVTCLEVTLR